MPALVTGASGFLGGRLAELLVERGEPVTVLARPAASLAHLAHLPQIRVVRGSLTDDRALAHAVQGATEIYHCAAASTDWAHPDTYLESNVRGTEALVVAACQSPTLRRFVHVSTTDVYGYPEIPGDETSSTRDVGLPYNHTKLLAEQAVRHAFRIRGLPVTVVRPATIYGPRGSAFVTDFATHLRKREMLLVDSGRHRGGFLYVDDCCEAMLLAAHAPEALGQTYNLCDADNGTWRTYVDTLADGLALPRPWINLSFPLAMLAARAIELPWRTIPSLPGRPMLTRHAVLLLGRDQQFPIAKAVAELGFRPRVLLPEGIARSVAWLHSTQNSA